MGSHYEEERELQGRMEQTLAGAMPDVDVLDVELDLPQELVRVFVDHPDGVSHELCARVTVEVRELCPQYALEVSSPGIERPLRRPEHFRAAVGERVKVRRRGGKRPFQGTIEQAADDNVTVRREDGSEELVPYGEIVRSHLVATEIGAPVKPGAASKRKGMQA